MTNHITVGGKFKGESYKSLGAWMLIASFLCLCTGAFAAPVANANYYLVTTGTTLQIPAGGVLTNDTPSSGLTAVLVTSPSHGTLTLTNNGGFAYTPSVGFTGTDTFTYRASDGTTFSAAVPVTITVRPVGSIFYDNFSRATNASTAAPWTPMLGQWSITGDELIGTHTGSQEYEDFYVSMNLTDYRLQGRVQFPQGAWGGGFAGRLNASTGAKYMAVIYPAGSQGSGGLPLMRLIKFHSWNSWNSTFTPMAEVSLPDVGTNWHTERLEFRGTRVMVYLDDILRVDATDNNVDGLPPLTNGGFAAHMYSENSFYTTHYDDVLVTPLQPVANDDSFTVTTGKSYSSSIPGVLANDLNGVGSLLVSTVVTGPIHGTVALSTNGSFIYTPANGYLGSDSFTYADSDGSSTSPPATVSITIVPNFAPDTTDDYFIYAANTSLVVAAPGILTNDVDANGDGFFASLVSGPNYGSLTLNTNGGFTYTPSTNFTGLDQFIYTANDGAVDSSPTTVFLKSQPTPLFSDSFSHTGTLSPWVLRAGNWDVSGGLIDCGPNNFSSYGNVYVTNVWTNFTVQARIQLPEGAFGASLGGRLNRNTGAQYTAWVYPENSPGGSNVLKLIKFSSWTTWGYQGVSYTPMAQVNLPPVGTNWHKINLSFHDGTRIAVSFDDVPYISVFDADPTSYPSGGVSLNMWTDFAQYQASFEDVVVTPLVNDVAFSTPQNRSLTAIAPGVTANCTPVYNTNLTAVLLTSPTNGALSFSTNGAFVYTPNINLRASDMFTCRINDGATNLGTARVTITVTPSILTNQTINFPSIVTKTYGNAPFAALATASSGLPVSYSVLSGPATVSSGVITITGNGNVTVRASQSGDLTNYNAAPNVDQSFAVTRALLSVTADSTTRLYGASNPVLTASYSGFVNGESAGVLTGVPALTVAAVSNTPPGNYAITAGLGTLSAANYDFTYTAGTLTISPAVLTITASATSKTYDGTTLATVTLGDNRLAGDTLTITHAPAHFADKNVGSNKVVSVSGILVGGAAAGNYTFNTNVTTTGDIGVRALTITASASDKTYDGTTNVIVTLSDNRVSGDNLTNSFGAAGFVGANAGTGKTVNVTGIVSVGGDAGNYTHNTTATTTANIVAASLTVTANGATRVYGATNPVFTASYSGFVNSETLGTSGVLGSPALECQAGTNSPVGSYTITCTNGTLASSNYSFSFVNSSLSVTTALLTVAADHKSRLYGTTNPVLTATISGFVNDDTVSAITGVAELSCAANATSVVGNYEITPALGSLAATNYSFVLTNGTLTVGKATLVVTAGSTSRLYGATNPVLTASFSGFVDGDTTNVLSGSPELTTTAYTNSPVGSYTITCTNGTLIATNYAFSFVNGTMTVTRALLSVTADSTTRLYGASNPVLTASYSGFVNGESAGVLTGVPALTVAAVSNTPPGNYAITAGLGTLSAANYDFTYTAGTLTISPAVLTITASATSKTYDGTTLATVTLGDNRLAGDTLTITHAPAHFADKNVGSNKVVSVSGILVGGAAAGNYTFNTNVTTTGDIGVRALTITASASDKTYDGTTNVIVTLSDNRVSGDNLTNSFGAAGFVGANAGTGKTVNVTGIVSVGGDAGNYTHNTTATTTANIVAASLTVTANGATRVYGATNPVFTASYSGFVNSETLGTSGVLGSPALECQAGTNSPVGSYTITCTNGTLASSNYSFSFVNSSLSVTTAASSITWSNPADIIHGVALSGTQLNAVGSVSGTFTYTPVAGTVLDVGSAQALTVTLTPSDTNYTAAVATVFINVLQAATTNFLLASEDPAGPGDTVTFTSILSVVAPGAGMPVGQVEFAVDGSTVATSVMTNGVARFSTSTLAHGAHVISARFAGDSKFSGCSNTLATLEIIDRAPVTGVMLLGTKLGLPLTLNVSNLMETASDPDGDAITLTNISSTSANGGLVSVNSGSITYTPPTNATGSDSFSYTVTDTLGLSTTGLVTIINSQSATVITPVQILTNGHVVVYFAGAPGHSYTVRASADLSGWSDIGNVNADSNGAVQFEDAAANTLPYRFYRIAPGL